MSRSLSLLMTQTMHVSDESLDFKEPCFSNKECTVLVNMAAVVLNSHFSFRFTSPFTVSDPRSSLEFIRVLHVWQQRAMSNAACLAPVMAYVQSYGSSSCLQEAIGPSGED